MVRTYGEAYRHVKSMLAGEEGMQAASTARELLSYVDGHTPAALMGMDKEPIDRQILHKYLQAAERILSGEPLAYILGQWSFYGMTLTLSPDVLIPRDDTMTVVDLALERKSSLPHKPRILDLCTGSGCIGLALATRLSDAHVTLCDISEKALKIAEQNALDLSVADRVRCRVVDVLLPVSESLGTFDMIVSNPPYITADEMKQLQPSVRDYEPHLALYGGVDGLDFYRAIIKNFTPALRTDGYLCFEFGQGQEDSVIKLLEEYGYLVLELRKDSGDIVRAVIAQKKERHNAYGNG